MYIIRYFKSLRRTTIIYLTTVVFLSSAILTGLVFRSYKDPRTTFENKLLTAYRQAPPASPEKEKLSFDQPGMAAFMEYLITFDPATGKIPVERRLHAYRATRALMAQKSSSLQWNGTGAEMGGRTRMIMYDPNDPAGKKVWAAGITGGLWFNNDITNKFSPWNPIGDFWPNLSVRCMAYDPNNTQHFYLGTGEVETAMITYRESSGLGDGIWKSTDGGVTWTQLTSTQGFAYVTRIIVRNEGGQSVIYAGVASGTYKGSQHQSQPADGLFRSADGGVTWTQVLPAIIGGSSPYAVSDVALGADNRIYVGSRPNLDEEGGATILISDDGLSWQINEDYKNQIEANPQYPIPGRVVFGPAPSSANVIYALISSGYINSSNGFRYFNCYHILRSADKGQTWTAKSLPQDLTSGNNFATIAWHALDIGVDPNNPDALYIGGLDVHKSTNGGTTWNRISDWSLMYAGGGPTYIHADQHIIAYKPGSSSEILFGTDGGVFYTANGTALQPTLEEHNQDYNTLQFYTGSIHPEAGKERYIGGLQDNGSLYYNEAPLSLFDMMSGGDGAYCFYDENNPSLFITSIYYNQYYVFNNGSFVNYIGDWYSGTFVSPADYDSRLDILYANAVDYLGGHQDQIVRIKNLQNGTSGQYLNLNTGTQVAFSVIMCSPNSPSGKTTLLVGSQSGRLFRVEEAQSNSPITSEIGDPAFPAANLSSIAIGNSDDTLLVTFSNYGVSSVWQTNNGGQSWSEKEGNLPDMPIRWAIFHPENAGHVMLATETGIWITSNIQAQDVVWEPQGEGMANVRVDMLRIRKADLTVLAASHGRGLFTTTWDLYAGTGNEKRIEQLSVYPNPAHGNFRITLPPAIPQEIRIRVYDHSGREVVATEVSVSDEARNPMIDLTGNPSGVYFIQVTDLRSKVIASGKIVLR